MRLAAVKPARRWSWLLVLAGFLMLAVIGHWEYLGILVTVEFFCILAAETVLEAVYPGPSAVKGAFFFMARILVAVMLFPFVLNLARWQYILEQYGGPSNSTATTPSFSASGDFAQQLLQFADRVRPANAENYIDRSLNREGYLIAIVIVCFMYNQIKKALWNQFKRAGYAVITDITAEARLGAGISRELHAPRVKECDPSDFADLNAVLTYLCDKFGYIAADADTRLIEKEYRFSLFNQDTRLDVGSVEELQPGGKYAFCVQKSRV